jgi:hypothetical protein
MADFQPVNLAQIYGAADQANGQIMQNQVLQMKMKQAQQSDATDQAVKGAYAFTPDGGLDEKTTLANLYKAAPDKAYEFQQALVTRDAAASKTKQEATKAQLDNAASTYKLIGESAKSVLANPTLDNAINSMKQFAQMTGQDPTNTIAQLQQIGDNPVALKQWAAGHALTAEQNLSKLGSFNNGQFNVQTMTNPITGQVTETGRTQMQASPDAVMSNARTIREGALNRGVTMRGQNMTDARAKEANQGTEVPFTPEAISNAASRYNIDGTLPPMGMGKTGAMARSAILNEAAVQAGNSGLSGDEQRIQQIGNKANSASLSKLQQSQSMVGAFEKNFNKNADLALGLSDKVGNTGVPIINQWINVGKRTVAGDPALSAYDLSIKATVNEYSKIISGSMGNTAMAESEVKKVESLLSSAQTPEQVKSVINMMKTETQNRMQGYEDQKAELRASMRSGKPAATQPAPAQAKQVFHYDAQGNLVK